MQANEPAAVLDLEKALENRPDNYCDGVKHAAPQTGPNLIDGLTGTPTPKNLLKNMRKHNLRGGSPLIPKLPPRNAKSKRWDIEQCNPTTYPWQTHHLIPKKFLPKQPVCVWLTAKWDQDPEYQLEKDTRYSTDHANNGYCLPFASTSHQWKCALNDTEKSAAAELLMKNTGRQLHQGNHDTQDFGEQEVDDGTGVEPKQYLGAIEQLLLRIHESVLDHTDSCNACKSSGKRMIQPLHRVVDQIDRVSLITQLRIDANKVFVSTRAALFASKH